MARLIPPPAGAGPVGPFEPRLVERLDVFRQGVEIGAAGLELLEELLIDAGRRGGRPVRDAAHDVPRQGRFVVAEGNNESVVRRERRERGLFVMTAEAYDPVAEVGRHVDRRCPARTRTENHQCACEQAPPAVSRRSYAACACHSTSVSPD